LKKKEKSKGTQTSREEHMGLAEEEKDLG